MAALANNICFGHIWYLNAISTVDLSRWIPEHTLNLLAKVCPSSLRHRLKRNGYIDGCWQPRHRDRSRVVGQRKCETNDRRPNQETGGCRRVRWSTGVYIEPVGCDVQTWYEFLRKWEGHCRSVGSGHVFVYRKRNLPTKSGLVHAWNPVKGDWLSILQRRICRR